MFSSLTLNTSDAIDEAHAHIRLECWSQLLLLCRIRQSVETASAAAAKEVARADALARAARKAKSAKPGLKELERLKVLSSTLQPCQKLPSAHLSCLACMSCT